MGRKPASAVDVAFPSVSPHRLQVGETFGELRVVENGFRGFVWLEPPCGHRFLYDGRNLRATRRAQAAGKAWNYPKCRQCAAICAGDKA